jgi:N-sulfoglucosamine sulfohydrolase
MLVLLLAAPFWSPGAAAQHDASTRPGGPRLNILLITADDLQYDSLGVNGCKLTGITPNLDRLASQGMRFERAHVTVAVCQPCRSVLMTGRYPFNNGARGFEPIRRDIPTLGESLRAGGYFNGIFAKVGHLAPIEKYCWDVVVDAGQLASGRDPARY